MPSRIAPRSPMDPSNRQTGKAVSARQEWWGSATVVDHEDTDYQHVVRRFQILRILFRSLPVSSAMGMVTWHRNARRIKRIGCIPMVEVVNCAEKRTTWRGTVDYGTKVRSKRHTSTSHGNSNGLYSSYCGEDNVLRDRCRGRCWGR